MKNFFSDIFDSITKLVVTQLGIMIFGLVLALTSRVVPGTDETAETVLLITSLLSVALYMFIIYSHIWEKGAKDRIKVDGGRMDKQILKGLWIGLCSNCLNIILALVVLGTYYFCNFDDNLSPMLEQICNSCHVIGRFLHSMYIGILQSVAPYGSLQFPVVFLALSFPAIVFSTVAYILGFNNFKLIKTNGKHK